MIKDLLRFVLSTLVLTLLLGNLYASAKINTFAEPWRAKVSADLQKQMERHETIEAIILMKSQASLAGAASIQDKKSKGRWVFQQLQAQVRQSQTPLQTFLRQQGIPFQSLYLVNACRVVANATQLQQLAVRPDIAYLYGNPAITFSHPYPGSNMGGLRGAVEWNLEQIRAPAVWAMGYTGQGAVIGGQDTGYDADHPALRRQFRGFRGDSLPLDPDYSWFDGITSASALNSDTLNPCGYRLSLPCDDNGHGTHTMGTIVGDDGAGNQVGVAPGAKWIGARNMERGWGNPWSYLNSFQWFLAPTEVGGANPNPDMAPDVINNSWYCPDIEGCSADTWPLFELAIQNLRAAGVVVVASAGNSGSSCSSISWPPAGIPGAFAVGATDARDSIAPFSSRGPVFWADTLLLKPDVTAPGMNVRSAIPGGGYASFNGTSMSGPHVAGTVALMISANPSLAGQVDEIEQILRRTADPFHSNQDCEGIAGGASPNAVYGYGRINALRAVEAARAYTSATQTPPIMQQARVFPVPASGVVTLVTGPLAGPAVFTLFTVTGKPVWEQTLPMGATQQIPLELNSLSSGIYFYQLVCQGVRQTGKVILQ